VTVSENSAVEYATAAHGMLLRLAGQLPDESVAQARQWLADGETGRLAEAVASAALAADIPVTEAEAWLLQEFLGTSGPDLSTLAQIGTSAAYQACRYHFEPDGPGSTDQQTEGDIDQAVIATVAAESSVRELWRARRSVFDEAPRSRSAGCTSRRSTRTAIRSASPDGCN
jgi:hypothetical protein